MPRISRACDACRTRKVRCSGARPCAQCSHFDVLCVFSPPERRKNPIRGRLVAKVRGEANDLSRLEDTSDTATTGTATQSPSPGAGHARQITSSTVIDCPVILQIDQNICLSDKDTCVYCNLTY